ncbi:MAG: class I SAM-dependent methyltransferase [Ignavibacteriales bacterium]|nr:MAG: class I SAM-dependent methyltransferase [Ignavibacteriaceae bacterium]MBW7873600.1 class I SAM-dependent methyltransferase [Ignavibacteria bacterium]MCZ2143830.1 class I SAM-dependent methyltransferase [Ignavibacteriales bacterium]OQY69966.1 MAG: hypothetical protein B6D45_12040 [Ignavibacteriales bacterium UTCHB3]MBV6445899.1 hypothetical protein [Ignavibacteriaceae bacterium]
MVNIESGKDFITDVIDWDVVNWRKCLPFFEKDNFCFAGKKALAIGEKDGGLSLWLAAKGSSVISTDLNGVSDRAKEKHAAYHLQDKIKYSEQNILSLNYPDETFDIVIFKSVLGALREKEKQQAAINEIRRVLKPGGTLFFAENLVSTSLHTFLRKKFIKWASYWRYITISEAKELCAEFTRVETKTAGFWEHSAERKGKECFLGSWILFLRRLFRKVGTISFLYPQKNK